MLHNVLSLALKRLKTNNQKNETKRKKLYYIILYITYTTIQMFGDLFRQKLLLSFSKDALIWSKVSKNKQMFLFRIFY